MGANIYLAYIPFARSDNEIIQTVDRRKYFDTSSLSNYRSVDVENLRILQNGTISFIIDLGEDTNFSLDYDQYNSVVLNVRDSDGKETDSYKYYMIRSIAYTSATNYLVTCDPLYVNAVRSGDVDNPLPMISPTNVKSKSSFVERGYAHDSILDSDGCLNLDSNGSTDLYTKQDFPTPTIPTYHKKLDCNVTYYNSNLSSSNKALINRVMSDYIIGWAIYYLAQGTLDKNDVKIATTGIASEGFTLGSVNATLKSSLLMQPYGCIVLPIINKDKLGADSANLVLTSTLLNNTYEIIDLIDFNLHIDDYLKNAEANVIYSKVVKNCPLMDENIVGITTSVVSGITTYTISINHLNVDNVDFYDFNLLRNDTKCCISPLVLNGRPRRSLGISRTTLESNGYPKGFNYNRETINPTIFKSTENPYIVANLTSLTLSNKTGSSFEYSPIMIGRFDTLVFIMLESLTPDITKEYVYLDTSNLNDSLLRNISNKELTGLVSEVDNSYPYSVNRLNEFLANNKNFFSQKVGNYLFGVGSSLTDAFFQLRGNVVSGAMRWGGYGALSGFTQGMNTVHSTIAQENIKAQALQYNITKDIDTLKSAPEVVKNINGNVFFSIQLGLFGFFIDMYGSTELIKNIAYRDFIDKGMYINRYLDANEVQKYISITNTPYDKRQYKYCKGEFNFYYDGGIGNEDIVDYKLVDKFRLMYSRGVYVYNVDEISGLTNLNSSNSIYQNTILKNVDEEDFIV